MSLISIPLLVLLHCPVPGDTRLRGLVQYRQGDDYEIVQDSLSIGNRVAGVSAAAADVDDRGPGGFKVVRRGIVHEEKESAYSAVSEVGTA